MKGKAGGDAFDDRDERTAVRFACCEKPKHRADIISKFLQPLFPCARFSAGLAPDYFLQCSFAVTRECARVVEMASGRHGGVRQVQVTAPHALEQLRWNRH